MNDFGFDSVLAPGIVGMLHLYVVLEVKSRALRMLGEHWAVCALALHLNGLLFNYMSYRQAYSNPKAITTCFKWNTIRSHSERSRHEGWWCRALERTVCCGMHYIGNKWDHNSWWQSWAINSCTAGTHHNFLGLKTRGQVLWLGTFFHSWWLIQRWPYDDYLKISLTPGL